MSVSKGIKTIIYPVKDVARAKKFYTELLGTAPFVEGPYYIGFKVGDQDIGLDPNGHAQGMTGPLAFVHVDDIRQSLRSLLEAGAQVQQDVRDVGGGRLVASVIDGDGNAIGLLSDPSAPSGRG